MTGSASGDFAPVLIRSVRPNLEVSEVEESIAFFGHLLGLEVLQQVGEPASFAILGLAGRGEAGTGEVGGETGTGEAGREVVAVVGMEELAVADVTACYIEVQDLGPVVSRIEEHGLAVVQEPTEHPWGLRDVVVSHPDGHLIGIGQRT